MYIGVAGLKGAGKDTVSNYFVHKYGFHKYAFAEPIYQMLSIAFPLSTLSLISQNPNQKEQLQHQFKETELYDGVYGRHLLQNLGTDFFRSYDPNIWIKLAHHNTQHYKDVIFSDVRFPEEVQFIKNHGGILIYVEYPLSDIDHDNHESESHHKYLKEEAYDTVINGFGWQKLYNQLERIYNEVKSC